jgi:hypothetical protein
VRIAIAGEVKRHESAQVTESRLDSGDWGQTEAVAFHMSASASSLSLCLSCLQSLLGSSSVVSCVVCRVS